MERHELVVLGAGTAGFAAAETARAAGRDVLLIAGDDELGGTCIRRGCMPAKALLAAAHAEGNVEKAAELGVETGADRPDPRAIVRRKRALVDYFAEDRVHELERYPLVRGDARFIAPDAIAAGGRRIVADRFVVATGATCEPPPLAALDGVAVLTSTEVLELTELPRRIAVLGGGPIGCSFAQYLARLGARVTLYQDAPELLRNDDPDVGAAVRAALRADRIEVVLNAVFAELPLARDADAVLVATNRRPAVAALDLAAAGVAGDAERGITVDATLRSVSNPRVWAAGDVLGRRAMVHTAEYGGRLAARNAFAPRPEPADWDRWEAHALYTDPEVAVAGLTERACRERGLDVAVARLPASEVGKAVVSAESEGFVKMLARRDDGRIAGIAIVAAGAVDLAGEAIAAIARGMTARDLAELPHLHPTMSELLARVAEKLC